MELRSHTTQREREECKVPYGSQPRGLKEVEDVAVVCAVVKHGVDDFGRGEGVDVAGDGGGRRKRQGERIDVVVRGRLVRRLQLVRRHRCELECDTGQGSTQSAQQERRWRIRLPSRDTFHRHLHSRPVRSTP